MRLTDFVVKLDSGPEDIETIMDEDRRLLGKLLHYFKENKYAYTLTRQRVRAYRTPHQLSDSVWDSITTFFGRRIAYELDEYTIRVNMLLTRHLRPPPTPSILSTPRVPSRIGNIYPRAALADARRTHSQASSSTASIARWTSKSLNDLNAGSEAEDTPAATAAFVAAAVAAAAAASASEKQSSSDSSGGSTKPLETSRDPDIIHSSSSHSHSHSRSQSTTTTTKHKKSKSKPPKSIKAKSRKDHSRTQSGSVNDKH